MRERKFSGLISKFAFKPKNNFCFLSFALYLAVIVNFEEFYVSRMSWRYSNINSGENVNCGTF